MATRVALQYGIFGGSLRGGRFRAALRDAGYTVVTSSDDADIIIAHSAGCFWLPQAPTHQRLLLIDPPYWPEKTIKERVRNRSRTNMRFRSFGYSFSYWAAHMFIGLYYAIFDFKRTRRIMQFAPDYDLDSVLTGHRAILIHNDDDDWLSPDLGHLERRHANLQVVHLPGDHDNCWYNPEPYVALLADLRMVD